MQNLTFSLLLVGILSGLGFAETPGSQFNEKHYIEYIPGTLPLVIGAPHGGNLKPSSIPDRTFGVVDQDASTQEMARMLREALLKKTGGAPAMVISLLHRSKLDPNREIKEAAQDQPEAEKAWKDWQAFIVKAKARVMEQFGVGLYIDLHGQRHPEGRIELGYMISPRNCANQMTRWTRPRSPSGPPASASSINVRLPALSNSCAARPVWAGCCKTGAIWQFRALPFQRPRRANFISVAVTTPTRMAAAKAALSAPSRSSALMSVCAIPKRIARNSSTH